MESIPAQAWCAVVVAIAIVVEIKADQCGVRQAALRGEDAAQFPSTEKHSRRASERTSFANLPDATQDKPVPLVVYAKPPVRAGVGRVGQQQIVGGRWIHGDGFGVVINGSAEGVRGRQLKSMCIAFPNLKYEGVIDRVRAALHQQDSPKPRDGPWQNKLLIGKRACCARNAD